MFETDPLEELVANLMASGLQFVQLPTATTAAWQKATLYDPAGNLVTLYRATAQMPITASLRATSNVMPHTD
ncbi:hypothetical protein IT774_09730 [Salinimonas marina]|uniref:VOC domain-containing protein n=1 Tax=Salinimonas marina TaxID=2785918 RepID=A0A7S9DV82_9ALTE|nr:hypothetical protein [Salinimonas marina]QPG04523.1 hypothetical protein IT774_09730 [Salinimonas marina]